MAPTHLDIAALAFGMAPVGAVDSAPPWAVQYSQANRRGLLFGSQMAVENEGPTETFGFHPVTRGIKKVIELFICHASGIDPKWD